MAICGGSCGHSIPYGRAWDFARGSGGQERQRKEWGRVMAASGADVQLSASVVRARLCFGIATIHLFRAHRV